jgi:glycosyltransferase involved in cell wall biosynthesis
MIGDGGGIRSETQHNGEPTLAPICVSIIIPAFDEEAGILKVLAAIRKQHVPGCRFEVIVVDDGSHDGTPALLQKFPDLYDKLVTHPKISGKGAAVISGLKVATGTYVLFQDADLEYSPQEYTALFYPITEFGAQIVLGSRFLAPKYTRVQYFSHKVGNRLITLLFNLLYNMTFTDIYSCYLIYQRDLVTPDELVSRGWEQHAEILCRAVRRAKIVYEVPISYHGRTYEEGKKIRGHNIIEVLIMIIRSRFMKARRAAAASIDEGK